MCTRYSVGNALPSQIENEFNLVLSGLWAPGEIFPVGTGPVLMRQNGKPACLPASFGFTISAAARPVLNARSEGVLQSRLFGPLLAQGRAIVPASCFYEWKAGPPKIKYAFSLPGGPLYMAGLVRREEGGLRFVVVTTAANASVAAVHSRMPLIFTAGQAKEWLCEAAAVPALLTVVPPLLEACLAAGNPPEQLSLF